MNFHFCDNLAYQIGAPFLSRNMKVSPASRHFPGKDGFHPFKLNFCANHRDNVTLVEDQIVGLHKLCHCEVHRNRIAAG
jgi:hypothetical protein